MKKTIKILQVFTVLNRGGAETNLMNYYRHFDRDKFHFDFLVHRFEEGAFEAEIKELGSEVFRIRPLHPLTFKQYKKEARNFLGKNYDYQIIHNHTSELACFLLEESNRAGFPIHIVHAHNSEVEKDIKSLFRYLWRLKVRNNTKYHFSCGKEASLWLFGKKKSKEAWQMNNAIETYRFRWNTEIRNEIRKKENISGNLNFIHTGRFNTQKNHLFLIDVFGELVKKKPEAQLYLIGDGELRPEIERKIAEKKLVKNVHLLGVRDDVHRLLQGMDYFLFPSLFEGLPLALVEAQASGIKCFISDGVPKEGILVKENVEVIPLEKSPKEWAAQICLHLDYERKDVSEIIKEKGYDIHDNVRKLEEKYTELLANKKRM